MRSFYHKVEKAVKQRTRVNPMARPWEEAGRPPVPSWAVIRAPPRGQAGWSGLPARLRALQPARRACLRTATS